MGGEEFPPQAYFCGVEHTFRDGKKTIIKIFTVYKGREIAGYSEDFNEAYKKMEEACERLLSARSARTGKP